MNPPPYNQENGMSLVATQQRTVLFMGDELMAVRADDNHVYVSLRNLCDALGIVRQSQRNRINRNEVLSEGYVVLKVMINDVLQEVGMLRANLVPLWLAGVSTSRVSEETRQKLIAYQTEAAQVLWEAFQDGRLTSDSTFDDLIANEASESVQAYKLIQAMLKLARQQIMLESQVSDHERRLADIETQLGNPDHHITSQQASHLSQAVKAVAMALSKQTKRNEFGGVYGELYRRYEITSYKDLPAKSFEPAMKFLTDWYQQITNEDIPF